MPLHAEQCDAPEHSPGEVLSVSGALSGLMVSGVVIVLFRVSVGDR